MTKISFLTWIPRPFRGFIYYFIILLSGRFILFKKATVLDLTNLKLNGILKLKNIGLEKDVKSLRKSISIISFQNKFTENGELIKRIYDHQSLINIKSVLDFAVDPYTIELCEDYFESRAQVCFVKSWESFANVIDDSGEMSFHMDHHGYKFLKKFCYLDDTFEGDGEHHYIRRTTDASLNIRRWREIKHLHPKLYSDLKLKKQLKGGFRLSNDQISEFFCRDIEKVTGDAGTVFIEDTYGLHRGTPLREGKSRLILQVVYAPWVLEKDRSKKIIVDPYLSRYPNLTLKVMNDSYSFMR